MLKVVLLLIVLLCTGVISSLDQNTVETAAVPDQTLDEQLKTTDDNLSKDQDQTVSEPTTEPTTPKPKLKKTHPQLNYEQINMLAEKVMKIHGVKPDSTDDENLKNIEHLKKVVASVEKNLNEKLLFSKLNKLDTPITQAPANNQASEVIPAKNTNEKTQTHEEANKLKYASKSEEVERAVGDVSDNIEKESGETANDKTQDEIPSGTEENRNEDESSPNASEDINVENQEPVESQDNEDGTYEAQSIKEKKTSSNNSNLNANELPDSSIGDIDADNNKIDNSDVDESINEDEIKNYNDKENDNSTDYANNDKEEADDSEVVNESTNADEVDQATSNQEENDKEDINGNLVNTANNTKQGTLDKDNEDLVDTANDQTEEEVLEDISEAYENNYKQSSVEDEILEKCSLDEGCDQANIQKTDLYSKESNSDDVTEKELENVIEDSYIQRLFKYATSFLN